MEGRGLEEGGKQLHGAAPELRAEAFTLLMAAFFFLFPAAVCRFPISWAEMTLGQTIRVTTFPSILSSQNPEKKGCTFNTLINTQECSELHDVCFTLKPSICARSAENDEAIGKKRQRNPEKDRKR